MSNNLDVERVIKLSEDKYLNILTALHDVYEAIDRDVEEAKFLMHQHCWSTIVI